MNRFDPIADAQAKNAKLGEDLAYAKEHRGYLTVFLGGTKIHAAVKLTRGHSGYNHPRALCQQATPRSYGSHYDPRGDEREVTCLRCLASLDNLKDAAGAKVEARDA